MWSDETKAELFGHECWRKKREEAYNAENMFPSGTVMLWGCFCVSGTKNLDS